MNNNKILLINNNKRLTQLNASIILEADKTKTFREMIEFLDILKTYFDMPEYIYEGAIWILKQNWHYYREYFNRIPYEPVVIAAMLVSYDHCELDPKRDPYTFLQDCFHETDLETRLYEVNRAEIEIKEHIYLNSFQKI